MGQDNILKNPCKTGGKSAEIPPLIPSDEKMVEVTKGSDAFSEGVKFGLAGYIEDSEMVMYSDIEPVSKGCLSRFIKDNLENKNN